MSKLVLHIGTHKTATTTIQKTLHHNRTVAFEAGLVYPDLPQQHHGLVTEWIKLPEFYHYPAGARAHWEHITKTNASSDRTVLISSEEFSRGSPNNQVNFTELRELVADFDEIEVVCLIRDQLSLIQSIFFEVYRNHGRPGWNNYFAGCLKTKLATGVYLDYSALYDRLLQDFSADEITFLPFRPSAGPSNPLATLMTHMGFADLSDKMSQEDANRSSDPLATWLSIQINSPNGFDEDLAKQIVPLFEGRKSLMYTRPEAQQIRAAFEPLNMRFLERYTRLTADDLKMNAYDEESYFFRDRMTALKWIELARLVRSDAT
ncbi:hypothetical protein [uncultured Litoreibacter sp.]|uniref:hypothetical protein n=1 Tax=uncultured Litoreibacter sp. TaxID=1392394 RepID=UPI002624DEC4|nr:hypothetical protein [uncultured Litoreibacter sp.]